MLSEWLEDNDDDETIVIWNPFKQIQTWWNYGFVSKQISEKSFYQPEGN